MTISQTHKVYTTEINFSSIPVDIKPNWIVSTKNSEFHSIAKSILLFLILYISKLWLFPEYVLSVRPHMNFRLGMQIEYEDWTEHFHFEHLLSLLGTFSAVMWTWFHQLFSTVLRVKSQSYNFYIDFTCGWCHSQNYLKCGNNVNKPWLSSGYFVQFIIFWRVAGIFQWFGGLWEVIDCRFKTNLIFK